MPSLESLIAILKSATERSKALAPAWVLVALAAVAGIATKINGQGKASVLAIALAVIGFLVCSLLSLVVTSAANSNLRRWLEGPTKVLVMAIVAFIIFFLALTALAYTVSMPCNWVRFLEIRATPCDREPPAANTTVSIKRLSDFTGTGCDSATARTYTNKITDILEFSHRVEHYQAQAIKQSSDPTHQVAVEYTVNGRTVEALADWTPEFPNLLKKTYWIRVGGNQLTIRYHWHSQPPLTDNDFGFAFRSSLPIAQLRAEAKLPAGVRVSGVMGKYADLHRWLPAAGCAFTVGERPTLTCDQGQVTRVGNESRTLSWDWDAFAKCS